VHPVRADQQVPLFTDWVGELNDLSEKYTDAEPRAITDFLIEAARRQRNATARLTAATTRNAGRRRSRQASRSRPSRSRQRRWKRVSARLEGLIQAGVAHDDGWLHAVGRVQLGQGAGYVSRHPRLQAVTGRTGHRGRAADAPRSSTQAR
jgi:hypothetical protein